MGVVDASFYRFQFEYFRGYLRYLKELGSTPSDCDAVCESRVANLAEERDKVLNLGWKKEVKVSEVSHKTLTEVQFGAT